MKIFANILNHLKTKKLKKRSNGDKEEAFLKEGTEQFKALIRKGLAIPVTLL